MAGAEASSIAASSALLLWLCEIKHMHKNQKAQFLCSNPVCKRSDPKQSFDTILNVLKKYILAQNVYKHIKA